MATTRRSRARRPTQVAFRSGTPEDAPASCASSTRTSSRATCCPRTLDDVTEHAVALRRHRARGRVIGVRRAGAAEPRRRRGALARRRRQPRGPRAGRVADRRSCLPRARVGGFATLVRVHARAEPLRAARVLDRAARVVPREDRARLRRAAPSSARAGRWPWRCSSTAACWSARARATRGCRSCRAPASTRAERARAHAARHRREHQVIAPDRRRHHRPAGLRHRRRRRRHQEDRRARPRHRRRDRPASGRGRVHDQPGDGGPGARLARAPRGHGRARRAPSSSTAAAPTPAPGRPGCRSPG